MAKIIQFPLRPLPDPPSELYALVGIIDRMLDETPEIIFAAAAMDACEARRAQVAEGGSSS
jgi:hypothetical protein